MPLWALKRVCHLAQEDHSSSGSLHITGPALHSLLCALYLPQAGPRPCALCLCDQLLLGCLIAVPLLCDPRPLARTSRFPRPSVVAAPFLRSLGPKHQGVILDSFLFHIQVFRKSPITVHLGSDHISLPPLPHPGHLSSGLFQQLPDGSSSLQPGISPGSVLTETSSGPFPACSHSPRVLPRVSRGPSQRPRALAPLGHTGPRALALPSTQPR